MHGYRTPPWLIGGNAQTIWPALFSSRYEGLAPQFTRERWATPDGDFIDVDWQRSCSVSAPAVTWSPGAAPASKPISGRLVNAADAPLLVLFHGLEGSSASHYAQAFAHWARRRGWDFAVPHFRGCSGELNLAPRAYHSADFEEVGWVLQRLRARHRGRVVAVGISLGGNALLRWAEEAGESAGEAVSAVCAVSAPVDLTACGHSIGAGFNRHFYTRLFLRTMKPNALRKLVQHPGLFDRDRLIAARTLYEFDNVFTAPLHGFRDTDDYWSRGSAKPHLARIRIPALVLNAHNDPFVPAYSLPRPHEVGQFVRLWQPRHGGHVGFPGGRWPGHLNSLPEQVMGWIAEL